MRSLHVGGTANANLQNRINISIIFNYLRESGPLYRAQIAKHLRLSAPAVSRAIESLIDEGYVLETEKVRIENGRKAARLSVNSEKGYVIAVDLMRKPIRIAVSDFSATILAEYDCFEMKDEIDVEALLVEEIRRVCRLGRNPADLTAICIGIPAVVDASGSITSAYLYSNLHNKDLNLALGKVFNVPVFIENVANLSALAESTYGAGVGVDNFVFIEVSNGIGAGVIIDRNLYRGKHGGAGEIGYSITGRESLGYQGNSKGFLENYASIEALRDKAIDAVGRNGKSLMLALAGGEAAAITPAVVCLAAMQGDEPAIEVVTEIAELLAVTLSNMSVVLDPERIIVGGDICRLPGTEELFLAPLRRMLGRIIPFEAPQIVRSELHEKAVVVGATHMAVESLLVGMYPYKIQARQ